MSYHNIRNSKGQFAKKKAKTAKTKKVTPEPKKFIVNAFLLDDSGSMRGKEIATISGFNEVLDISRVEANKNGIVALELFSVFSTYYRSIGKINRLIVGDSNTLNLLVDNNYAYSANGGSTALYDAIALMIADIDRNVRTLPINSKVVFTIFTDGEENSSRITNLSKVRQLIESKQKDGWVINFIGAGEKFTIERTAQSMGIFASNALSYQNNSVGTRDAFTTMSSSLSNYTKSVADNTSSNIGFFSNK